MKSITLHNLDDQTVALVEERARKTGKSLNKTIKELLRQALGLKDEKHKKNSASQFLGVWSEEEFQEFEENTKSLRQIDESDWQ